MTTNQQQGNEGEGHLMMNGEFGEGIGLSTPTSGRTTNTVTLRACLAILGVGPAGGKRLLAFLEQNYGLQNLGGPTKRRYLKSDLWACLAAYYGRFAVPGGQVASASPAVPASAAFEGESAGVVQKKGKALAVEGDKESKKARCSPPGERARARGATSRFSTKTSLGRGDFRTPSRSSLFNGKVPSLAQAQRRDCGGGGSKGSFRC